MDRTRDRFARGACVSGVASDSVATEPCPPACLWLQCCGLRRQRVLVAVRAHAGSMGHGGASCCRRRPVVRSLDSAMCDTIVIVLCDLKECGLGAPVVATATCVLRGCRRREPANTMCFLKM